MIKVDNSHAIVASLLARFSSSEIDSKPHCFRPEIWSINAWGALVLLLALIMLVPREAVEYRYNRQRIVLLVEKTSYDKWPLHCRLPPEDTLSATIGSLLNDAIQLLQKLALPFG